MRDSIFRYHKLVNAFFIGWYIALIDQEEELRAEKEKNKAKAEINDAEQHMLMIEKQAERLFYSH